MGNISVGLSNWYNCYRVQIFSFVYSPIPDTFNDTLEFFAKHYANYAYATGRQCSVGNKVTCAFVHVHSKPSHCEDIRQKNDQSLLYFLLINRIPTFIRAMRPRTLTVCCSAGRGENLF